MAADVFLKIDGIKGESKDDKHKDEKDILELEGLIEHLQLPERGRSPSRRILP